jgi:hypothetical protein
VYQSGASLAVGVKVSAKLPGHLLNTSGWVYLVGDPVVGATGKTVHINNLRYATVLDNDLWKAISTLFYSQIKTELEKHSTVDFTAALGHSESQVAAAIRSATVPGWKLTTSAPVVKLESVSVTENGFWGEANLKIGLQLELTDALISH